MATTERRSDEHAQEEQANARLIAKAPEMVAMLYDCATVLRDAADGQPSYYWNKGGDGYEAFMRVRALLQEIEGSYNG